MKRFLVGGVLGVLLFFPMERAFGLFVPAEGVAEGVEVPDLCLELVQHLSNLECPQESCLTFNATFFRVQKEERPRCLLVSEKPYRGGRVIFEHEILSMTEAPNSGRFFAIVKVDDTRAKTFATLVEDEEKLKTFNRFFYNDGIPDGQPSDALLFRFNTLAADNNFWEPRDFEDLNIGVLKMSDEAILEEWNAGENRGEEARAEGGDFDPNADIKAQGEAGQPEAPSQVKAGGGCSLIFEEHWKPFSLFFIFILIPFLLFPRRRLQKRNALILPFRKRPPRR